MVSNRKGNRIIGVSRHAALRRPDYASLTALAPGIARRRLVGELKGEGEEYECAVRLDQMDEVETWIRNLERRPEISFWLQTSTDRFYPDFVARLRDGRILVVEYKGEDRWSNDDSKEKRALGELWAQRSGGRCLFVMPEGPDWHSITACVGKSPSNR